MKLKQKIPRKSILILSLITAPLISFFLISKIGKEIKPSLVRYGKEEAKRFANIIINYSVKEVVNKNLANEDIFNIKKNKNEEIEMIDFNTKNVNILLEAVTDNIQDKILKVETGNIKDLKINQGLKGAGFKNIKEGVVCEIPTGSLFENSLLANTGPIIPIKLSFIGKVNTKISTKIKEYGINNAYLEVNIHIEVTERITMPIFTEEVKIEQDIPIAMKVIQGKIPKYYNGLIESSSNSYALPEE